MTDGLRQAQIVIVCEGPSDYRSTRAVFDRILVESVDWISRELLDDFRMYVSPNPATDYLSWKSCPKLYSASSLRPIRGGFDGHPGAPDALAARRAIHLVGERMPHVRVVILVRDSDNDLNRLKGLAQARSSIKGRQTFEIAIGLAHPKREAWILAGFVARDASEQQRIDELEVSLAFNPVREPDRLRDRADHAPRSAKRVLTHLSSGDWDREECCLRDTSFSILCQNGKSTGFPEFLGELRSVIGTTFGARPM